MARISGPAAGGTKGWAFAAPVVDLTALGYQQEEYFLEGESTRYGPAPGTGLGLGRALAGRARRHRPRTRPAWSCSAPSRPRRVQRHGPVDLEQRLGGLRELRRRRQPRAVRGRVRLCRRVGSACRRPRKLDNPHRLPAWDPERYGTLSIPSDDYSFDIFTQAADLVAPDRPREVIDPMGGLQVRRLLAQGASQSAARLSTYLNAIQPITERFDAFFLVMYFGSGSPLEVGDAVITLPPPAGDAGQPRIPDGLHLLRTISTFRHGAEHRVRGDLVLRRPPTRHRPLPLLGDGRHLHISLQAMASVRTPDGAGLRLLHPARRDHAGDQSGSRRAGRRRRARTICRPGSSDGTPPPVQPRMEFGGEPPEIVP